ncbi:MAG TPA: type II toxin-antitoxin system RelE/ParE family toxin [Dissulfurispiraceae bacterium]|nr:type II toxin-antitoxin system RelE/ParE family toxin [Dissulfurispiraceae bacterium]
MWSIDRTEQVSEWVKSLDEDAKEAIFKSLLILQEIGPSLGRPHVDLIKKSRHKNMKELRIHNKQRLFRILFAFDPGRNAILLVGGDKRGDKRFYDKVIPLADSLLDKHLDKWRKKK